MIVGMSTACFFPDIYTEQAVIEIGKMHIRNIEVFFSCLSEYRPSFVREVKRRAEDCGINIYSIHALSLQFEPQLFSKHERARNDSLEIYKQVLEAGAMLGAKAYVFHGPSHVKHAKKMRLNYGYIAEKVDPLASLAQEHGIKLAWETVHWCWYRDPDFPVKLMQHTPHDNLYFTLDVKQAAQAGHDPAEYIAATGGKLANVHLCDYRYSEEKGMGPTLPFEGDLNIEALKSELAACGYDGPVILEVYSSNYQDYTQLQENYNRVNQFFKS